MLKELADEVAEETLHALAKYMLMNFHIKEKYKKQLEGVIYVDCSSRIQIIECEKDNPVMFRLLNRLKGEGMLALINTSLM